MKSLKHRFLLWKLRRVIAALSIRTSVPKGEEDGVTAFAKMLEATFIMMKGSKKDTEVVMTCTYDELNKFIRYMTTLHDSRLSLLIRARIGLATLIAKDEDILGDSPKTVLDSEYAKAMKGKKTTIVDSRGKEMEINV